MGSRPESRDPRIDAYIAKSAEFARPILKRLRETVHEACPEIEETMKWGSPSFVYAGGILCGMAAFKQHASFGYWKHALVMGADAARDGMGSYGKMAGLADLPPKKRLIADIKKAMKSNEQGVKTPGVRKSLAPKPPPKANPATGNTAAEGRLAAMRNRDAGQVLRQCETLGWLFGGATRR
ncbi:DUF1801 domain-containing protein [Luteimonas sp. SX5]|uniref:DUF1801 domain-containing protein n=1 Tax=Luteimonas galliterrae TaxID=2940486 RepID=A0ABT0MEY8_9GAMM|nr:DUF1801 domain-containing protein [Luteimonas galliterrae]MCL1633437.1 DUF1801 domain-containing protein [Luteimonas galliterrae]